MHIRRCRALLIEPDEAWSLNLGTLLSGGDPWQPERRWRALAAHLDTPVELSAQQLQALEHVPVENWSPVTALPASLGEDILDSLLRCALVFDRSQRSAARDRDEAVRATGWYTRNAVLHRHGLWSNNDSRRAAEGLKALGTDRRDALMGPPPPAIRRRSSGTPTPLPAPGADDLDDLLARRVTCRNFDSARMLPLADLSRALRRALGAQAIGQAGTTHPLLKKFVPSAGGLHPTEAYLVARRVEGLRPALYHYLADTHALEPVDAAETPDLDGLLDQALAGQAWFADAPVHVVLASRFERNFWKYREHSKAYRAVLLDIGHVSQMLYLSATQQGLGCFVTSAINELPLERALGLDGLREGVIAVSGLGYRSDTRSEIEFDPQGRVWPEAP